MLSERAACWLAVAMGGRHAYPKSSTIISMLNTIPVQLAVFEKGLDYTSDRWING